MKKAPLLRSIVFVNCLVCSMVLFSCKKEAVSTPQMVANTTEMKSNTISTAIAPSGVLGNYFNRGSRTVFRGKAGDDNAILSLDYINDKKLKPSLDDKGLVCGYGETNFVNQGWQYVVRYNLQKGEITLAPNDVMAAAIQPNSFKTYAAIYDPFTHTFNFLTSFMDKNGNENQVMDILTKE